MPDKNDKSSLMYWVELFNKSHGYAGQFNHGDADDKAIVEMSTAKEWLLSIEDKFSISFDLLEHNPDDPPDCFLTKDTVRYGLELVQMVEAKHKMRASQTETPYAGVLFCDMQWTKERLEQKLNTLISQKGEKYSDRSLSIDYLLVYTAETWLASTQVEFWLKDIKIKTHPNIHNVYLLMRYEPGRGTPRWPVFDLYSNK